MSKISRNDPCQCGSGKKYKKCCMKNDDAQRVKAKQEADIQRKEKRLNSISEINDNITGLAGGLVDYEALDLLSNTAVGLIHEGRFDEAEVKCNELLTRYPEVVDGYDRFAMLYEKRGDNQKAAEYYQKAADFMTTAEGYAHESIAHAKDKVEALSKE
jgi:tetratricopeptide (TPR) repeat protein